MCNNPNKKTLFIALAMLFLLFAGSKGLFAQSFQMEPITGMKTTPIYVNGVQVAPNQWFEYKLEGIFRLEGYNLEKGTPVRLIARKGSKTVYDQKFFVNGYGAFKETVIIPDVKKSVKCRVIYHTPDGQDRELVFYFKAYQRL